MAIRLPEEKKETHEPYIPTVTKNTINFPVNVFPDLIQNYIKEQNKLSNFDVNLMASTYLWLISTIIGNKATTFVNENWNVSPVVWLMIIAERGSTKTHAINAIIRPAKEIDSDNRKAFEKALKDFNPDSRDAIKPTWKQMFLEDGTREGFIKSMSHNPGGLGLMKDELTGWIADMDKHTGAKGGDEAFWLSSFNNTSYTKNIKGDDGSHVVRMFINLAGSIQPQLIQDLAKKHSTNGLFDRFLLVPYIEKPFKFTLETPKLSYHSTYTDFIKRSISVLSYLTYEGERFYFLQEAEPEFERAYNYFLQLKYKDDSPAVSAYIAKIITYLPRLCLIIEVCYQLDNIYFNHTETIYNGIRKDSVTKALDILKYFLNNARNVLFDIGETVAMQEIIKDSGAIKNPDKARALIEAMVNKELTCTQADISRFLSMSKQQVNFIYNQIVNKKS